MTDAVYTTDIPPTAYQNTHYLGFTNANHKYETTSIPGEFPLSRASDGAGAGDAWSISFWYERSGSQYGQLITAWNNTNNKAITIWHDSLHRIYLLLGNSQGDFLSFSTPSDVIADGSGGQHILVTYNGGETGGASAAATYVANFKIYIDGTSQSLAWC